MTSAPREEPIVGRIAPHLALPSTSGELFRLDEALASGPVVWFFFIHGRTPG